MNEKAQIALYVILGIGALVGIIGGIVALAGTFGMIPQGSGIGDAPDMGNNNGDSQGTYAPFPDNTLVREGVRVTDAQGKTVENATVYLFQEEPRNWNSQASISRDLSDAVTSKETDSNGEAYFKRLAGETFYRVVEEDGHYYMFDQMTFPDGTQTQESASDYNNADHVQVVSGLTEYAVLESKDFDLGVDSNETNGADLSTTNNYNVDDGQEFRAKEIVVKTDSTNDFTDSSGDGDNVYDEGVETLEIEVSGKSTTDKGNSVSRTLFDPSSTINMFADGTSGQVTLDVDHLKATPTTPLTVQMDAYAVETSTTATSADDETLGDGEVVGTVEIKDDRFASSGAVNLLG